MDSAFLHHLDAFRSLRVLVIGDAMLDSYLHGRADRLCQEAPVPVVSQILRRDAAGGAANTAVTVQGLGAQTRLLSVVGEDAEGGVLRDALTAGGVDVTPMLGAAHRRTLAKQRVIGSSQLLLRFDQGSTESLDEVLEQRLLEGLGKHFAECDVVIVSDYRYGVCTPRVIDTLGKLQAAHRKTLLIDSKRLELFAGASATAAKPNYEEVLALLGLPRVEPHLRAEQVAAHAERILSLTGAQIAAVTLDVDGVLLIEAGHPPLRVCRPPVREVHAAGAGDAFSAALALSLAAGAGSAEAAELATTAASLAVRRETTAACSADDLRGHLLGSEKVVSERRHLHDLVTYYRHCSRRIVFTNGCFDVLHPGHVDCLHRARALGDVLFVGANSDAGVRALKGNGRPIHCWRDRAQLLGALHAVDHIVEFDEDTPARLIREIRPDVFVKGGDYTRDTLPEAPLVEALGGRVHIVPYVQSHSTSGLVQRIRSDAARPAEAAAFAPRVS